MHQLPHGLAPSAITEPTITHTSMCVDTQANMALHHRHNPHFTRLLSLNRCTTHLHVKGDYCAESPSTTTNSIHSVIKSIKKFHWCITRGRDYHSVQQSYKEVRKDDCIKCAPAMHLELGAKPNCFTIQYHQN